MNYFDAALDHIVEGQWAIRSMADENTRDRQWLLVEFQLMVEHIAKCEPDNEGVLAIKRFIDANMCILDLKLRGLDDDGVE